ncbi:MAG: hypothetical protein HND47_20670 [Chloroflexi bacterium]|nr:hypothetical protein [Chloroflexota bacterium]
MLSDHELKNMMNEVMKLAGEDFEIIRGAERRSVKGARNTQKSTHRKYVQFYPGTDVKAGDILIRQVSGEEWLVTEIDHQTIQGKLLSVNAFYETRFERERQPAPSVSYTFHNSSNIIAGSQTSATMNINIGEIEKMIEENGGADKEELLALVMAIKEAFEKQDTISKGSLARFSEMLERHSWIMGSLVQLLGSAAIQFFIR